MLGANWALISPARVFVRVFFVRKKKGFGGDQISYIQMNDLMGVPQTALFNEQLIILELFYRTYLEPLKPQQKHKKTFTQYEISEQRTQTLLGTFPKTNMSPEN